jgi:hypothetical protein
VASAKGGGRNAPQIALKSFISLHVGGVLDPGEACRNRVTLSIGRLGSDSGYSLVFGLFEKNECEESIQMEDDVQVSGV